MARIVGDHPGEDLVLGPLGLTPRQELIYRHILARPGVTISAIASALSMSRSAGRAEVLALEDAGLVSRAATSAAGFVASSPKLALEALFLQRRLELDQAHSTAQRLLEEAVATGAPETSEAITLVEGRDAVVQQAYQLQSTATQEMLVLERNDFAPPPKPNPEEFTILERGVRCRVVYERSVLEMQGVLDQLREWALAGEESRVAQWLPIRMMLADRRAAWIPLHDPQGVIAAAAVIRSRELLDGFLALFESIWSQAVAISDAFVPTRSGRDLTELETRILALLLSGLKDEAIARQIGVDTSTVRRHIKRMMARLGATTRFQAGAQASRLGLV